MTIVEVSLADMSILEKKYKFQSKIAKSTANKRTVENFLNYEVSPRIAVLHSATYGKTWKVSSDVNGDIVVDYDDEDAMTLFALKSIGFK